MKANRSALILSALLRTRRVFGWSLERSNDWLLAQVGVGPASRLPIRRKALETDLKQQVIQPQGPADLRLLMHMNG
jgi:hypothetical protein